MFVRHDQGCAGGKIDRMGRAGKGKAKGLDPPLGAGSSLDRVNRLASSLQKTKLNGASDPAAMPTPSRATNVFMSMEGEPAIQKSTKKKNDSHSHNHNNNNNNNHPHHNRKNIKGKNQDIGMDLNLLPSSTSSVTLSRPVPPGFVPLKGEKPAGAPLEELRGRSHVSDVKESARSPSNHGHGSSRSTSRPRPHAHPLGSEEDQWRARVRAIPAEGAGYVKMAERQPFTKAPPREDPSRREYNRSPAKTLHLTPVLGWDLDDVDDDAYCDDPHLPTVAAAEHHEWKQWKAAQSRGTSQEDIPLPGEVATNPPPLTSRTEQHSSQPDKALLAENQDARFVGRAHGPSSPGVACLRRSSLPLERSDDHRSDRRSRDDHGGPWDNTSIISDKTSRSGITSEALSLTNAPAVIPETGQMLVTCPYCHCRFGYPPLSRMNGASSYL